MMEEERSVERKRYEEIKERYEAELSADIKRFEEECSMYRKRYEEYIKYLKTIVFNLIQMNWTDEQIVNQLGLPQNWLDEIRKEL